MSTYMGMPYAHGWLSTKLFAIYVYTNIEQWYGHSEKRYLLFLVFAEDCLQKKNPMLYILNTALKKGHATNN